MPVDIMNCTHFFGHIKDLVVESLAIFIDTVCRLTACHPVPKMRSQGGNILEILLSLSHPEQGVVKQSTQKRMGTLIGHFLRETCAKKGSEILVRRWKP